MLAIGPQLLASFLFCCNKALKIGGYMNYLAAASYIVVVIIVGASYTGEVDDYFNPPFATDNGAAVDLGTGLGWVGSAPPSCASFAGSLTPAPRSPRT